ncbi:hypothetical protein BKA82DRAFT_4325524 [Pisolithus tinctorius]|nr:hypothetical protein BKA82DRAFT_4325524 [Pisolithus tinctorius]
MATHHCDYCLKTISTVAGVKRHISQSAACQQQWKQVLERTASTASVDEDHQLDDGQLEYMPNLASDWHYKPSDDGLDLLEGSLVQQHASVEDVEDGSSPAGDRHFIEQYTGFATRILGSRATAFKEMKKTEQKNNNNQWAPFQNKNEWDLACFLMKNMGQTKINEFLKLSLVRESGVSFSSAHAFLKYVDSLRTGPAWTCEMIDVVGDTEQVELWRRDPVECVMELIGNPAFRDAMAYSPEHAYTDSKGTNHIYDEMWTANWWWDVQGKLPASAMVAPVILSSDKTSLSMFSGDKKAWPVYLTIGNISKDVRQQVSAHATTLIGYLPISKLECFEKKTRSLAGYRLFHHAMSLLLRPLGDTGRNGEVMICADGCLHRVHLILAAYVADFPEQCLVACSKESRCPLCLVQSNKRGDRREWACHSMADTLKMLQRKLKNGQSRRFDDEGLRAVFEPFWKDLPFTNIFACITPDILHQLLKGVFHDHLLQWCIKIIGEKEIDARFRTVTQYPALRHFAKGISTVLQWTSKEHKEMQRVFVGLLSGAVDKRVLAVTRSLLDFFYYTQLQQHMEKTLKAMQDSLDSFHDHKHVLVELEVREDFNIPKIHSLLHYVSSIRALGSADGYNTEYPERLHIDYAKDAYRASNKHDYVEQMALWLQRQEAIHYKSTYLAWRQFRKSPSADSLEDGCFGSSDSDSEWGEDRGRTAELPANTCYRVTKFPSHSRLSIDHIWAEYKAAEFTPALKQWLSSYSGQHRAVQLTESDRFDIYHNLIITGHQESMQKIRTMPKPDCSTRFDTAFVLEEGCQRSMPLVPNSVRVAQVRVIFKLPDYFGNYPHPLVYVEWFTALHRRDPASGLYIVTRSTRHHRPNVAIISADCIVRACHLQARCGKEINADWSADNVLDRAAAFYVNSYINLDMFITLE